MMNESLVAISIACVLCLLPLRCACDPLTFDVNENSKECFYQESAAYKRVHLKYEVIAGGQWLDIGVAIWNEQTGKAVVQTRESFVAADGKGVYAFDCDFDWKICFDNGDHGEGRRVWLDVSEHTSQMSQLRRAQQQSGQQLGAQMDSIKQQLLRATAALTSIENKQQNMRRRRNRHQHTQDSSNARAKWLRVLETALVLALFCAQTLLIRSWFGNGNAASSFLKSSLV